MVISRFHGQRGSDCHLYNECRLALETSYIHICNFSHASLTAHCLIHLSSYFMNTLTTSCLQKHLFKKKRHLLTELARWRYEIDYSNKHACAICSVSICRCCPLYDFYVIQPISNDIYDWNC